MTSPHDPKSAANGLHDLADGSFDAAHDRRRFLKRAAIAGAATWVVPTVLTTTPAVAQGGSCPISILDFDPLVTDSTFTSQIVDGVTVSVGVAALPSTTLLSTNRTIRASPNGGFAQKALQFQMLPNAVGIGQDITFTFSNAVSNITFSLFDIDNQTTNGWGDRLVVTSPSFGFTIPTGSTVTGTGTTDDPFRNSTPNDNLTDTENLGNLDLTFPGPTTSIVLNYTNAVNTGGGNMRIGVSDISFQNC